MPVLDTLLGLAGLAVSVFAIMDNRRVRNGREKAVIAAREAIARTDGLLHGIKAAVKPILPDVATQIDDGLQAIKEQGEKLDAL